MRTFFQKHLLVLATAISVLLIGLDQFSKWLAVTCLKGQNPFVIWDGVFEFYYFENTGAAWGMMKNQQLFFYILTIVFCAVVVFEIYRLYKEPRYTPFVYSLFLVLAGAVGNFIDRIANKYVIDFLYFKLINFPIFNLADCYITIAVVLVMLLILFYYNDAEFEHIFPCFAAKKKKDKES